MSAATTATTASTSSAQPFDINDWLEPEGNDSTSALAQHYNTVVQQYAPLLSEQNIATETMVGTLRGQLKNLREILMVQGAREAPYTEDMFMDEVESQYILSGMDEEAAMEEVDPSVHELNWHT